MSKGELYYNRTKLISGSVIVLLGLLLGEKMPYSDKSISLMLFPIYKIGDTHIYSGMFLIIILLAIGCYLIITSRRFKRGIIVVVVALFVVSPLVGFGADLIRSQVYSDNVGVKSLEIIDSDLNIHGDNNDVLVSGSIEIKNHNNSNSTGEVEVYLELAEAIRKYTDDTLLLIYQGQMDYFRESQIIKIQEPIVLFNGYDIHKIIEDDINDLDYTVILKTDTESYNMIVNDLY